MVLLVLAAVVSGGGLPPRVLRAALDGDRDALRALIAVLEPVLRARVRRKLIDTPRRSPCLPEDVEETVQETFAQLFRDDGRLLRRYSPDRGMSLLNYVGQIAEREAGRVIRSRGFAKRRGEELVEPDDYRLDAAQEPAPDVLEKLQQIEHHEALLGALRDRLSDESFLVFEALYIRLLPAADVAAMFGCAVEAIYTRRHRIRATLRTLLEERLDATSAGDP